MNDTDRTENKKRQRNLLSYIAWKTDTERVHSSTFGAEGILIVVEVSTDSRGHITDEN